MIAISDDNTVRSEARVLEERYGEELFDHPPGMTRERLERRVAEWDELDPHFTKTTFDFLGGMRRREILDDATRALVLIGQFTVTRSLDPLEDVLLVALAGTVKARDALEAILLGQIYAGITAVTPALRVFRRVATDVGALGSLRSGQLPISGHPSRDLASEREQWPRDCADDPRTDDLIRRHGWLGISTGIHYRGKHHLDLLEHRDALDPGWADLWLRFTYQGMYSRGILDDRSRILCTVGDTLAVGDLVQAREHMTEAVRFGIPPRQLMELVFMIGPYFGSPRMGAALRMFEELMGQLGLVHEIRSEAGS